MDLVIKNAIIAGEEGKPPVDIGIDDGLIAAIADNLTAEKQIDAGRKLVSPGLVESHIHLDKSNIFEQSRLKDGSIAELFLDVIRQKRDEFSTEDIRRRAITTLEKSIQSGVTHMRTQLEVDPYVGLRGLDAVMPLIDEYKWAIDLEICVFPEEPLFDLAGTEALMIEALDRGCRVVGGLPSGDRDSTGHIDWVFERAKEYDIDIDMHLDANDDPEDILVEYVCDQAEAHGYQGRVTVAHLNKEAAIPEKQLLEIGRRMAGAGVATTVLPTTDLYLGGRHLEYNIVRGVLPVQKLLPLGVNASLATNNLNNGITPIMRCSPLYQANSFAISAQVWKPEDFDECFEMITRRAAKILRREDYGIKVGNPADLVVLDCRSRREAVCAIAPVLYSFKAGQMITRNHQAEFFKPTSP